MHYRADYPAGPHCPALNLNMPSCGIDIDNIIVHRMTNVEELNTKDIKKSPPRIRISKNNEHRFLLCFTNILNNSNNIELFKKLFEKFVLNLSSIF